MKRYSLKNLSIKYKINIYIMAFLALLLVTLWVFQVVFFNAMYKQAKKSEAQDIAQTTVGVINGEIPIEQLVEEVAEKEVCIIVLNNDMEQIQSLDGPKDCVIHKMPYNEKVDIAKNIISVRDTKRFLEYEQEDATYRLVTNSYSSEFRLFREKNILETLVYVNQVPDGNGGNYVILVNAEAAPMDSVINTSRTVLSYVTIVTIILATVLNFIIAKSISRPILQINEKAKMLASGDYDTEFKAEGYREIYELSQTMANTAEELSKLEKLRQEFIANVSHDLRTPLTMIGGYAEVMRDIPGENSAENAQVIIDETKRLSNMVTDVLNIAKIQSGSAKPNKEEYNFTHSIQQIVQNMAELMKGEGYRIVFNFDDAVVVNADRTLIDQCFYNLLSNAVVHSKDNRDIIVTQYADDVQVKIEVQDFGEGISPQVLPHIWERYYKDTRESGKKVKSSGLGLSIVKTFIDAHDGRCGVVSEKGKGSTFWFSINIK
ncbi:MAG: HAMP domain-containing histidine kinase [Oscillospiraceae bacterium]|nr:HAMP domain-containing histidine kinase [Oscillospiraceae bacterium]